MNFFDYLRGYDDGTEDTHIRRPHNNFFRLLFRLVCASIVIIVKISLFITAVILTAALKIVTWCADKIR